MKKNLFMVAAVALVALVSCNKETNSPLQPAPVSDIKFEAEFVNEQTKTSIGDADKNGYRNVTWDLGELVHINGTLFTATDYKEDGKAIFVTEDLDFATAEQYDAIYPATAGKSLAAVTIPAAQDGKFANAAIAVAQSENRSLAFMNVASLIKFQVPAECSEVTFESTANLAGTFPVTFGSDGLPAIGTVSSASKTITLSGSFVKDKDYYVAVLPGSHKFTVRLDGYLSKASTKAVTTSRANIADLQALPAPQESDYKIMGVNGDWTNGLALYEDGDYYVRKNVALTASTEFKLCQGSVWGRPITLAVGKWAFTYDVANNLKAPEGSYDIYVSAANDAVCFVKAGDAMPEYKNENKLIHVLYEGKENCGLYIQSPSTTENGYNNSGAWGNFTHVYMKKTSTESQDYCAFPLPSKAVGVSCKFTIRVWGDKNKTYTMTLTDDTPFWGNSDNGGSYSLSSKIDIQ